MKCVQCQKEISRIDGIGEEKNLGYCRNQECPNYGLLQTGILDKEEEK